MPKQIDPIERALDAYSALDTDQKMIFAAAVRHIERAIEQMGHSVDHCKPQDETKPRRGRPKGSKNRKAEQERAIKLASMDLIETNAATREGL